MKIYLHFCGWSILLYVYYGNDKYFLKGLFFIVHIVHWYLLICSPVSPNLFADNSQFVYHQYISICSPLSLNLFTDIPKFVHRYLCNCTLFWEKKNWWTNIGILVNWEISLRKFKDKEQEIERYYNKGQIQGYEFNNAVEIEDS